MSGPLAVTGADESIDPVAHLVMAWLASKRSAHTRTAYGRDLGVIAGRRAGRVPSWLEWCRQAQTGPLEATEDLVVLWARALEAAGLSAPTRARKLSAVADWYGWLNRRGHIAASPAEHVARPVVDRDTSVTPGMTRAQALALLDAADRDHGPQQARTAALIAVLLFTGARVSEITGADVEDLGVDRGHRVQWVTRKGGKRQSLVLPGPAAARLDTYLATREGLAEVALPGWPGAPRPPRPLFATATGGRMMPADVWRLVRRLGKLAGLPAELVTRMGPHSLRHSFATLYLDAGGNLRDLQDALGHEDPRTTRRYDRARHSLDRSPGYALAAFLAEGA